MLAAGREPLVRTAMLRNAQLAGGMTMFFFQFMIQAGLFFAVPLFLSVALGLSAFETGVRLLPLSVTLLLAAVGIPKLWPKASPRRVVHWGLVALLAGIVSLILALEAGAGAEIVTVPMLLAGLGVGALSSQLGAVTVSAVPDEQSGEVGGLQNTATNLGASLGTALVGSVLITALSASFFAGIESNPDVPAETVTAGRDPAGEWGPVRLRRAARDSAAGRRAAGGPGRGDRRRERDRPDRRASAQSVGAGAAGPPRPVPHPAPAGRGGRDRSDRAPSPRGRRPRPDSQAGRSARIARSSSRRRVRSTTASTTSMPPFGLARAWSSSAAESTRQCGVRVAWQSAARSTWCGVPKSRS